MKLCFATNNLHKLEEIQALLGNQFELVTLSEIGCETDIPEPYDTIAENSRAKAEFVWKNFGINCFADDSGLEVAALNGEPGVKSARYAGPQRNADDNMDLLIEKLWNNDNRKSRFVTVITLVLDGAYHQFEGVVNGQIISQRRGTNGFGYDPIFVPDGFDRTFAEMTMQEKSALSHRGLAFSKLVGFLMQIH
ncbi:RdgB/HAM1 family non-canonical purine NTP pyrophosphatase [Dyadobacter sediminis]|uniref:dITP/XTP pyrophosphatase n=1 Tax=Dyadobacter sediminis TaxID=1493691 RepID=A0A5R9K8Z8_9BACT|nr:RdgB/HAM1 family non-canonical purine NTP pyrophosphatase [Dyadobacter sediminis]TLU90460.1 RdgB/HAM1 family non-canonical purine NTP pyrophosphatase [Dyadobacter sediminis]GGC07917.1 non-canonical purine NTP pyrophosphatase [Dyadobacter sediminis]